MFFDLPIIINNFNRVTTTKKLVEDLKNLGYMNIHILDNGSTYKPLLEWYDTNPCKVVKLGANFNQLALYNSGYINDFVKNYNWIAYTDSDIELNPNTPSNFIEILIKEAGIFKHDKCGLALRINDLPDTDLGRMYKEWEGKYWHNQLAEDVYIADVDTTFCVLKPHAPFMYKALRVGGDMTARHIPWYNDFSSLNEEEGFYLDNSSDMSTYKKYYNTYLNQKMQEYADALGHNKPSDQEKQLQELP